MVRTIRSRPSQRLILLQGDANEVKEETSSRMRRDEKDNEEVYGNFVVWLRKRKSLYRGSSLGAEPTRKLVLVLESECACTRWSSLCGMRALKSSPRTRRHHHRRTAKW